MKKIVHTETGSRYLIDYDNKTWERYGTGEKSGGLRSDMGQFIEITPLVVGERLMMSCPAFRIHDEIDGRAIITSPVVSFEDVPEC